MEPLWIIVWLVVSFLLVVFIALYSRNTVIYIRPSECGALTGRYGVRASTTGTTLQSCGITNDQECTFMVNTLAEAIALCDDQSDTCSTFSYQPQTGVTHFIDPTKDFVRASTTDLYQRRSSLPIINNNGFST